MDERYVTWGRWEEAHTGLVRRVWDLEQAIRGLAGAETIHGSLSNRITSLEDTMKNSGTERAARRNRAWVIILAVMTGIVFPLVLSTVITILHLRSLQ